MTYFKKKLTPWNVDTISKDKFAKTIINKDVPKKRDEDMTEEERAEKYVIIYSLFLKLNLESIYLLLFIIYRDCF